eukprot:1002493-Rhodomonas_salina.2
MQQQHQQQQQQPERGRNGISALNSRRISDSSSGGGQSLFGGHAEMQDAPGAVSPALGAVWRGEGAE